MSDNLPAARRPLFAFVAAIPIALLGGMIGLGGAEFRLPVLADPLRYAAKQAVPLNLAISLITLGTSLVARAGGMEVAALGALAPVILAMIAGALLTAFLGPALASRIGNASLERVILVLLVVIGTALIVESFLPTETAALVPAVAWPWWRSSLAWRLVSSAVSSASPEAS